MTDYLESYSEKLRVLKGAHEEGRAMELLVGGNFIGQGVLEKSLLFGLGLKPTDSVIDVGCGSGRLAFALSNFLRGQYCGTDILAPALDFARTKANRPDWQFRVTTDSTIACPDNHADIICFFSVFTHLRDEDCFRYLQEATRVAKPGALIVLSFLDFDVSTHWPIFAESIADLGSPKVLNRFHSKATLDAWSRVLGLTIERIVDGSTPWIELTEPISFDDGRLKSGIVEFGQSVCVLRKPDGVGGKRSPQDSGEKLPMARSTDDGAQLPQVALRGHVGSHASPLIAGFSVARSSASILVRGIGSSLKQFGITPTCERPNLTVVSSAGTGLTESTRWYAMDEVERKRFSTLFHRVGAFALVPGSDDALLIADLSPGAYTVVMTAEGLAGVGLIELYLLEASER